MFDSSTKVESPWRAANRPAVKPARPEPTIATSKSDMPSSLSLKVQTVQAVQPPCGILPAIPQGSVQSPTSFLPRDAGKDEGGGGLNSLNFLNFLNVLNSSFS